MRLLAFLLLLAFSATAQQVPSKMTVAGVKVTFTAKLQHELQEEVDALTRSPKYFQIKVDRADIYFPIIEQILAEEEVPDDVKYLVLQESALIPDAVSVSDAVGYWQFKDFTAMEMGLRIDNRIDERMHIIASTQSAARYLKKNYTYFNNWLYAIQAYQMGAGGAMKVVDKRHYGAKSMHLDHNLYWYVKKYIAHKIAFEAAVNGNGKIKLTTYDKASNKSLEQIAKDMAVDYNSLVAYNAWLRKGKIPDDIKYPVIIPVSSTTVNAKPVEINITKNEIKKNEPAALPGQVLFSEQNKFPVVDYKKPLFKKEEIKTFNGIPGMKVEEQNSVVMLASAADISLNRFLKYNDIDVSHKPKKGQVYYFKRKKAKAETYYHVVMPGETLWEISQKYGIRMKKLMHKNRLVFEDDIKPGLVLWLRYVRPSHISPEYKSIPKEKPSKPVEKDQSQIAKKEKTGKVKPKQFSTASTTTASISSSSNNFSKEETPENANKLDDNNKLSEEGSSFDSLKNVVKEEEEDVPDEKEQMADDDSVDGEFLIHTIRPGETLYSLSKEYNVKIVDILNWNDLKISDKLAQGQELKIIKQNNVIAQEEPLNLQPKQDYSSHTVEAGETLYQIARRYEVTVEEIMEWNNKENYSLSVGEVLQIKK